MTDVLKLDADKIEESNRIRQYYVPKDNFESFCAINDAGSYFDELKIPEPMDLTRTYPDFVLDYLSSSYLRKVSSYTQLVPMLTGYRDQRITYFNN